MKPQIISVGSALLVTCYAPCSFTQTNKDASQQYRKLSPEQFRTKAREQADMIRDCRLDNYVNPGGFPVVTIKTLYGAKPAQTLYDMGIDVLPVLVNYLGDASLSGVVEPPRVSFGPYAGTRGTSIAQAYGFNKPPDTSQEGKRWKVNELVARLIGVIARRDFYIGPQSDHNSLFFGFQGHPESIPQFKRVVSEWYKKNRNVAIEDRKIGELTELNNVIQLRAMEWLGKNKIQKAWAPIAAYVSQLIDRKSANIFTFNMTAGVHSLAEIGDKRSLETVVAATNFMSEQFADYFYHENQFADSIFEGAKFRARLGDRDSALRMLKELYAKTKNKMREDSKAAFEKNLIAAEKW